jgi:putative DNA-invertase from lambdoid prophage Rac
MGRMATFGYCRVSTTRQAAEGESLEVQRRQIEG